MPRGIWTLTRLTPEQEKRLKEAEATLGDGVLLAFSQTQIAPSELSPTQLQSLQKVEQDLGVVLVAVKPTQTLH